MIVLSFTHNWGVICGICFNHVHHGLLQLRQLLHTEVNGANWEERHRFLFFFLIHSSSSNMLFHYPSSSTLLWGSSPYSAYTATNNTMTLMYLLPFQLPILSYDFLLSVCMRIHVQMTSLCVQCEQREEHNQCNQWFKQAKWLTKTTSKDLKYIFKELRSITVYGDGPLSCYF